MSVAPRWARTHVQPGRGILPSRTAASATGATFAAVRSIVAAGIERAVASDGLRPRLTVDVGKPYR